MNVLEKNKQSAPTEKVNAAIGPEELYPYYGPPGEGKQNTKLK